jgi:hypothetical protein
LYTSIPTSDFDEHSVLKDDNIYPDAAIRDRDAMRLVQFDSDDDCPVFNPLTSIDEQAAPSIWPRGFPLDLIQHPCRSQLVKAQPDKVVIFQSLSSPMPDVDVQF